MPLRPFTLALLLLLMWVAFSAIAPPQATAAAGTARAAAIFGEYVVYSGNFTRSDRIDLYSVPRAGGDPVRLSSGLPDGIVISFEQAGDRVVFMWYYNGRYGLYSAPLAGGQPTRLHPEYGNTNAGNRMAFAVAGDRAVFAVAQERRDAGMLYSVPVAGGTPTRLSVALPEFDTFNVSSVRKVVISDDNSTVAYTIEGPGISEQLHTVPVTGGASVRISLRGEALSGSLRAYALTPNGARVLYLASLQTPNGLVYRLQSVATDGTDRQELATDAYLSYALTPDGSRAVYFTANNPSAQIGELRSIAVDGGSPLVLHADMRAGFWLAPTSDVFFTPNGPNGGLHARSAAGGPTRTVLSRGVIRQFAFSAGGSAVFAAEASTSPSTITLYSYPLAGGAAQSISDPAVSAALLGGFLLAGERAVYYAIAANGELPQLYGVALAGGASVKLNGPYAGSENAIQILSTTTTHVLYGVATRAPGEPPAYARLLLVPADGSASPTAITITAARDPDGTRHRTHLPLLSAQAVGP